MSNLVTVLIPSYKPRESHIQACLDSCLFQSLSSKQYEVLICSDGTPSSSILQLLSSYSHHPNFRSVVSDKHIGLKNILNLGLNLAKGRYIARLDTDDIMGYQRLEYQLNYLKNHPEIFCVGSDVLLIDNDLRPLGIKRYPKTTFYINLIGCFRNPMAHPSVMFDLYSLSRSPLYKEESPYEDYSLWSTIPLNIANLSKPLTNYRVHPFQISSLSRLSYSSLFAIRLRFLRYFFLF